jgi:hypothetical protein
MKSRPSAILLVRKEIKFVADLSDKKIAIDTSQSDEIPDIKTAISKAGATGVEISEGTKFALGRVMDGTGSDHYAGSRTLSGRVRRNILVERSLLICRGPSKRAASIAIAGSNDLRLPLRET